MLNKFHEKQQGMELIILEQLVPQEHLLRKIDRSIDFSFIRRLCAPLYSANLGRPAIEPEVLFRMLFVGYLYGIRSERRLEEEINYNMAYKWFCGLSLTEKAPDATTLSVNRKRRFRITTFPSRSSMRFCARPWKRDWWAEQFCIRIRPTSRPKPTNTKR